MVTFKNGYAEVTFEGEENEFDGQNNDVNAWVEWTISKEFDTRNAEAIANEIGAKVIVFDPMRADWPENLVELATLIANN